MGGVRQGHIAGGMVCRTGKEEMNLRFTIEKVDGDSTTILHLDLQEVPEGMRIDRAVQFMANGVMEKFRELEQANYPHVDPYSQMR